MSATLKQIFNNSKSVLTEKEQQTFMEYLEQNLSIDKKNGRVLFSSLRKMRNNCIKLPQTKENKQSLKILITEIKNVQPKINKAYVKTSPHTS